MVTSSLKSWRAPAGGRHYTVDRWRNMTGRERGRGPTMADAHGGETVRRQLRAVLEVGAVGNVNDGALLERFVAGRGDAASSAAFAALVDRHGPMVLRVCRGVLRDEHEADDAAQATFLVLARRALAIRRPDALASWLFGVALRVAARSRAADVRRRRREQRGAAMR